MGCFGDVVEEGEGEDDEVLCADEEGRIGVDVAVEAEPAGLEVEVEAIVKGFKCWMDGCRCSVGQ